MHWTESWKGSQFIIIKIIVPKYSGDVKFMVDKDSVFQLRNITNVANKLNIFHDPILEDLDGPNKERNLTLTKLTEDAYDLARSNADQQIFYENSMRSPCLMILHMTKSFI